MKPSVRKLLASTVRGLRARLLARVGEAAGRRLLEQVFVLRSLEATDPRPPAGWRDADGFRRAAEALARELPGVFTGADPDARALAWVSLALDEPALAPCWREDAALGWMHQFWNDPARAALDAKLAADQRLARDELARKTQLFTDGYMIEWLLDNSLGPLWLEIGARNGWRVDVPRFRSQWPYFAAPDRRPEPSAKTPSSVRELSLLDPAVGAGHCLLRAFDRLLALYSIEARLRGEAGAPAWSQRTIVESILERNLHGVELDPDAARVAAVALWLKARRSCPSAQVNRLGLASTSFAAPLVEAAGREALARAIPGADVEGFAAIVYRGSLLRCEGIEGAEALAEALDRTAPEHDLGVRSPRAGGPASRFLEITRPGRHDIVLGNPPYQDTSDVDGLRGLERAYPAASTELYSMFMLRGIELARPGGRVAMVTKRGWLFLRRFARLRAALLDRQLEAVAELGAGAFAQIGGEVVQAALFVLRNQPARGARIMAIDVSDARGAAGKRDALRAREAAPRDPAASRGIEGAPLMLAWSDEQLAWYRSRPTLAERCEVRQGMATGDNARFLRRPWELAPGELWLTRAGDAPPASPPSADWVPYIKGASGARWFEPCAWALRWRHQGLEIRLLRRDGRPASRVQNTRFYFRRGVAVASAGSRFSARLHRFRSVFDVKGHSVFPRAPPDPEAPPIESVCAALNSRRARAVIERLNPSISFQVGDVKRLPLLEPADATTIVATLERAFAEHEARRETSIEFTAPGPSPWREAQTWGQRAVDREGGGALPRYEPQREPPSPFARASFALGVALGRFARSGGLLRQGDSDMSQALPEGVLFVDTTLPPRALDDSLGHPACAALRQAWSRHGASLPGASLRAFLGKPCFAEHRRAYQGRPIYWPLCSPRRRYIAWVAMHRLTPDTLGAIARRHLDPAAARTSDDATREELAAFRAALTRCAARGPGREDSDDAPPRERDASYRPCLADGVLVNAAPLWPLLDPLWPLPRETWRALAAPARRRDLDWSRTAARYWPARVERRCADDPSLAAAHQSLWRLHPGVAFAEELRRRFVGDAPAIDEAGRAESRAGFLETSAGDAYPILERALLRHLRRGGGTVVSLDADIGGLRSRDPARWRALLCSLNRRLRRAITLQIRGS